MDQLILDAFIGLRVTWLSPVIILFTQLTGPTLMFVYALVWGLLRKSATAPIAVGLANLISHFLKRAFERPRPNTAEHLVVETNFSFPSGHAVGAAACAVAVGYSVNRWWKLTLWVIAACGAVSVVCRCALAQRCACRLGHRCVDFSGGVYQLEPPPAPLKPLLKVVFAELEEADDAALTSAACQELIM